MFDKFYLSLPEIFSYLPGLPITFNSVFFIVLFSVFYFIYSLSFKNIKLRNILLLLFSLYFYYKLSGLYVFLLIMMATSDFFIGKGIYKAKSAGIKNLLVAVSLIINTGSLCYFKYADFFNRIRVDLLNTFFNAGISAELPEWQNFAIPLGISFYMFKTLSYIFDIKREIIETPEKNYINYLLYVSFFPNILAGPISKARNLLPQLSESVTIDKIKAGHGLFLILCGLFKKIFIADFLGNNFVDRVFDSPVFFSNFETIMAAYGYTMQLYFDFSGYTDIVAGLALLLGFRIEPNFNKPFLAQNISDFWRRWHITLSSWLNEYIFYPLSMNFRKFKVTGVVFAAMLTFFISGLWHGPAWKYILWGLIHGLAIAWDVATANVRKKISSKLNSFLYRFLSIFITFHFLVLSMVIFRADDITTSLIIFKKIFSGIEFELVSQWIVAYKLPFCILIIAFIMHYLPIKFIENLKIRFTKASVIAKVLIIFVVLLIIIQAYSSESQPFIYLKF